MEKNDVQEAKKAGKTCPQCGTAVAAGAKFCGSCGASLITLCPQCGKEVEPQAQFCVECGAAMSPEAGTMRIANRISKFLEETGVGNKHLLAGEHVTPVVLKAVHMDCLEADEKPLLLVKFKCGRLEKAVPGFWTKLMFAWVWGALLITDKRVIWSGLTTNGFLSMLWAILHIGGKSGSIALDDIQEACICDPQYTMGGNYCGHPVALNGEVIGLIALGAIGRATDVAAEYLNLLFAACFGE